MVVGSLNNFKQNKTILQMCVAINGLEYVRRWLLKLGEELLVEKLLTALECQAGDSARMQWRNALTSPLEQTPGQMLLFINQIVSRIGTKVCIVVQKWLIKVICNRKQILDRIIRK